MKSTRSIRTRRRGRALDARLKPTMFIFNVHFEARDERDTFSQTINVATETAEEASAMARDKLSEEGGCTVLEERVERIAAWNFSRGVKRVYDRYYGLQVVHVPPLPEWEPTETIDQEKLRRTLWPIVECLVYRDVARLPLVCKLYEGTRAENYFEEVDLFPARLVLPADDEWETLVYEGHTIPISDTSPQRWGLWGSLYTEEEGLSDLIYAVDVWDEGGDVYEAFLINVTVP